MNATLDPATRTQLLTAQKNEITEYHIYTHLGEEQAQINYNLIAEKDPRSKGSRI